MDNRLSCLVVSEVKRRITHTVFRFFLWDFVSKFHNFVVLPCFPLISLGTNRAVKFHVVEFLSLVVVFDLLLLCAFVGLAMADEKITNGISSDAIEDQKAENFYEPDRHGDNDVKVLDLSRKIESLELEKLHLLHETSEAKERIKKLAAEIEELKIDEASMKRQLVEMEKEIEQSEEAKKVLEVISARAMELETEVSRLQHDLITAMSDGEEANKELIQLKRILEDKGVRVENLERQVESLKQENVESEKRVRELERKIGVLEAKEIEEKSKKVRIEEEMREKIDEKDRQIGVFRKKAEDLESVIAQKGVELEEWMRENLGLQALLSKSEEKAKSIELKVVGLQKEVEEAGKVISGLKDKAVDAMNGSLSGLRESVVGAEKKGLVSDWPVVVGSTGAIAVAAAIVYVVYGRRR